MRLTQDLSGELISIQGHFVQSDVSRRKPERASIQDADGLRTRRKIFAQCCWSPQSYQKHCIHLDYERNDTFLQSHPLGFSGLTLCHALAPYVSRKSDPYRKPGMQETMRQHPLGHSFPKEDEWPGRRRAFRPLPPAASRPSSPRQPLAPPQGRRRPSAPPRLHCRPTRPAPRPPVGAPPVLRAPTALRRGL
jgi:Predicted membrane protein